MDFLSHLVLSFAFVAKSNLTKQINDGVSLQMDFYSANSLKQQSANRHVAPLGHIILIPSQPVFALSP
jgi:hypothetical protein